jgi:chromosome segregation ATPase
MTSDFEAGQDSSRDDEAELDRLIGDESAGVGGTILRQLREELALGEVHLREVSQDLLAARDDQAQLRDKLARLQRELDAARGEVAVAAAERDEATVKLRDMIDVAEREMTKVIDHTERLQHLRFADQEIEALGRRLADVVAEREAAEMALVAERAISAKHLQDLRGTQAHRDVLEQKIAGMLNVMHAETLKIVDHTERQHAAVVAGLSAQRRLDEAIALADLVSRREQSALAAIYGSTSWRLTKPWRFVGRMLMRAGVKRGAPQ